MPLLLTLRINIETMTFNSFRSGILCIRVTILLLIFWLIYHLTTKLPLLIDPTPTNTPKEQNNNPHTEITPTDPSLPPSIITRNHPTDISKPINDPIHPYPLNNPTSIAIIDHPSINLIKIVAIIDHLKNNLILIVIIDPLLLRKLMRMVITIDLQ